ncbi:MAG: alginate export family protein [Gemmataceae bacterium]
MRSLCRYSIRILAGVLLSHGLLGLAHGQERSSQLRWDDASKTWVRTAGNKPDAAAPAILPEAQPPAPAPVAPPVIVAPMAPPAPPVVMEGAPVAADPCAPAACPNPWLKVPVITPVPRPGIFIIPPDGCGYYSLLDVFTGTLRENRPKQPYGPTGPTIFSFFDADFRYLDDPNNKQQDFHDLIHRLHAGDNFVLATGGEFRFRYMNEVDSRLSGVNQQYDLLRTRVWGDLMFRDRFRLYAEFISANEYNNTLPPLAIDRNLADFLNLFLDVKIAEIACNPLEVRVGRQELLYGSQRLISPLDWANTRRTFEGVKAFWHSEKWDLDGFWVKPVIINPFAVDNWSTTQNFWGAWATYKPKKGTAIDTYLLGFSNSAPVAGTGGNVGGIAFETFGMRAAGDHDGRFLYDFEGMVQAGVRANQNLVAGAFTTSAGYRAKNVPWTPTLWVADDWASGNQHPGVAGANYTTFQQLFPFGHYYFGYLDLVGRQNINDFNMQLSMCPAKWITTLMQWHNFELVSPKDALYSAGGAVLRVNPAGTAGRFVGNELDFAANFHLTAWQDLLVGWSRLYSGDFIRNTGNPMSPELVYVQYSLKW